MTGIKSSGRTPLGVCIGMIVMSTIAVVLRLIAKTYTQRGFAMEDKCIIVTFLLFCGYESIFLAGEFQIPFHSSPV